jgi:uncharacterized protein
MAAQPPLTTPSESPTPESTEPLANSPDDFAGKRRIGPLAIAYALAFVLFGAVIALIAIAGSAADGGPLVALKLSPFPTADAAGRAVRSTAFRATRDIGGNLVADPALIEDSSQGPLPRIAQDGRAAMTAYSRGFDAKDRRPKIAVVIRGLGIGTSTTDLALAQLSPDITLAFAPFTVELQSVVDKARGAGHEVMLEIPMEPFDFPDSDPGPHALLVAASTEENGKRLDWALSRATGYAGIMNLLGGRFLGEENAIEPVLEHVARRGLFFFDNGVSSSSVAMTAARHMKAPIATGTLSLDAVQSQAFIDAKLAELENAARQDGFAIGVASAYPVTIARLAEWAANADARGFQLVPVSALAKRPPDATAATAASIETRAAAR